MNRDLVNSPPSDRDTISVEIPGDVVRKFVFGLTLNRRTFDRNPNAMDVDAALEPLAELIAKAWREVP